jgi:hypothetical protein
LYRKCNTHRKNVPVIRQERADHSDAAPSSEATPVELHIGKQRNGPSGWPSAMWMNRGAPSS